MKVMCNMTALFAAVLICCALNVTMPAAGYAQGVISANIAGHTEGANLNHIAPAASAGAFSAINWNNVIGANTNSVSASNLMDNGGVATTLDVNVVGNRRSGFSNNSTPDRALYSVNIGTGATSSTDNGALKVQITDIPYSRYDLYLYYTDYPVYRGSEADETNPAFMLRDGVGGSEIDTWYGFDAMGIDGNFYEFGTTELADALARATSSTAADPELSNYMLISGLTASDLEIIGWNAASQSSFNETGLAGFQIVQAEPVPEPASIAIWGMIGLGLLGYALRRRWQQAASH